ncbi:phosphoenolpyruvate--protein phosphotransferase [Actinoplanes teichomyceticus]|uniref:Phosphoenolpyruvate-protein phosphotransferase n=1 Tax=Actinoplanes teichomyceticus TaxID=1867 RepID=A0A561VR40_ACTTI|nr:phosphoenolpyruvate--protein phosphotransferase [Actinoplanes teichomyceticus]TWG14071.1 phosphotransferase system enzyme I (PtsI) [Actinoplanes teichomyceticus]TWG21485.1 phosphoenolpyruvate--protein phosphotransferase [Actinoplanes teichomyceticus]GIF13370.1 phosphoenolpyruvate-protein phosphotransferase [Actinoplanes teichomyceticus]
MPDATGLAGIGVSAGVAAGPLLRIAAAPALPPPVPVGDPEAEVRRAYAALAEVVADLERRADRATEATVAEVLRAEALMAGDEELRDAVREHIEDGTDAPHAIDAAFGTFREMFAEAGGYLAERVADLDDLRDRAVAVLLGLPMPGVPQPGHPYVLAARDLAPADTADLDPDQVVALVTEIGGPTSHTAILARALGLPAVVACPGVLRVAEHTRVLVDGATGRVDVGVDEATVVAARRDAAAEAAAVAGSSGPGRTSDGHAVKLLANVGSAKNVPAADQAHAEGIGLFRTELLFLDRASEPGRDEQITAYREVFRAMAGRRVVIRTLDAGADKPLPFLHQDGEPNPALGVRGLRVARRRPGVLTAQLAAIAAAAADCDADVWVMAPMVSTLTEATEFAAAVHEAGLPRAGVMIEVPAAALRAGDLLRAVDFLSIGTNDLSQYTFAADRMCGELADLLDPWQPALLQLIAICGAAGRETGKPVGVCGEAAADPQLAPVLAGLGISSLSMSPRALPAVRAALARHSYAECRRLAELAVAAPDAVAARKSVL